MHGRQRAKTVDAVFYHAGFLQPQARRRTGRTAWNIFAMRPMGKPGSRIVTKAEAIAESQEMRHAVEKHFRIHRESAAKSFKPASTVFFEQAIGLEAHIKREMPLFLTLRDAEGTPVVTAMLPPIGKPHNAFNIIIVGPENSDPYPSQRAAIAALGGHFGIELDRSRCYPYRRR
jgi:hypothetical protein